MGLEDLFINPETLPQDGYGGFQLFFLLVVYGYILMTASNLISDGSELLLLVPSLAGLVGSCVLPVLGAVPDGAIVLFSGLGENAQEELQVGIGALAGSTIMLLTIPWCLSIFGGRVSLDSSGNPVYRKPPGLKAPWEKLSASSAGSLTKAGVSVGRPVRVGGAIMGLTGVAYLFIQIPAFVLERDSENRIASGEKPWALAGFIFCLITFAAYLWYQYKISQEDPIKRDKINEIAADRIAKGEVSLLGVIAPELMALTEAGGASTNEALGEERRSLLTDLRAETLPAKTRARIVALTKPFFFKYDVDRSGYIDVRELQCAFADLGDSPDPTEMDALIRKYDVNGDGILDLEEFSLLMVDAAIQRFEAVSRDANGSGVRHVRRASLAASQQLPSEEAGKALSRGGSGKSLESEQDEDDEDDEQEEVPEDLKHLSWAEQQRRILLRSVGMMGLGTVLVLLFSDPMVAVLSELGKRLHISAFYVSFVLAPMASNASELIASYNYAKKKTSKTMSISLATLTGAGCMNNTFTLGLFLLIIYIKNLTWEFSAETLSILLVELVMVAYSFKSVHTPADALAILSLYPLSLLLVALLEKYTTWN